MFLVARSTFPGSILALLTGVFCLGLIAGSALPVKAPRWHEAAPLRLAETSPRPADTGHAVWSRDGNLTARYPAEVVQVIDGDTFEARVHLWPGLDVTTRVRLRGIDAPELKAHCSLEREMAEMARDVLNDMVAGGHVALFNVGPDKYNGRVVADAATRNVPSVSGALLAAGHARAYGGGHRKGWCVAAGR
jgi:endonuclease YncB( thermonuclease family)